MEFGKKSDVQPASAGTERQKTGFENVEKLPKTAGTLHEYCKIVDEYLRRWTPGSIDAFKNLAGAPNVEAEYKAGVSSIMTAKAFRKAYVRNKRK